MEEESDTSSENNQQGWGSWMWSYVPQILPEDEEGEHGDFSIRRKPQPLVLSIGIYGHKISITFKVRFLPRFR
jgi:hypothetical protein